VTTSDLPASEDVPATSRPLAPPPSARIGAVYGCQPGSGAPLHDADPDQHQGPADQLDG
jgi:hypothetical protein